jgi:hypothetical protein
MATTIRVPLNTMLADLDETVRQLLRRELTRHGFDGVEIAFEAPSREWSAQLSTPTVSLFLYDLRQSSEHRPVEWEPRMENGRTIEGRPPLRVDATYAVTAWTREVEDEHRLLSQLLTIFYAFETLPGELLAGSLASDAAQPYPLRSRVAEPRSSGSPEFWSSVGGTYKASLDYCVTLSCDSGTTVERGPEVRSHTLRVRNLDGGRAAVEEIHRLSGRVRDAEGEPVPEAWVVMPDGPGWTAADEEGRYQFDRVRAGSYAVRARAPDGREGEARVTVPGGEGDIVVGEAARAPGGRRRR